MPYRKHGGEMVEHILFSGADDGIMGARHSNVGDVCRTARENPLIRGLNVRMRPNDCRHPPVGVPAHGYLFGGCLRVEIQKQTRNLLPNLGQNLVKRLKGIVEPSHIDLTGDIYHA